jgi:hypothetical protein
VVIPVLFEQASIRSAVELYGRLAVENDVEVVFVSTDAEDRGCRRLRELAGGWSRGVTKERIAALVAAAFGPERAAVLMKDGDRFTSADVRSWLDAHETTGQLLERILSEEAHRGVRRVHYDGQRSSMALQVQAGAALAWPGGDAEGERYIAVYNIDSDPEPTVFTSARRQIHEHVCATGRGPNVLQQSSAFVGSSSAGRSVVAHAAGIAQTRWTFGTEMPRLRRQVRALRSGCQVRVLAFCVGHGVFIRAPFFEQGHGLPTFVMQEDLALGFLLSADAEPVHPLRTLDRADAPATLRGLNAQKQQWFWAYLEYPRVARHAEDLGIARRVRWALLAQAAGDGLLWLGTSPGLWAALALPWLRRRYALLSVVAVGSYVIWPMVRYPIALRARGHDVRLSTSRDMVVALAVVGTDSVGPYRALATAALRGADAVSRSRTARA